MFDLGPENLKFFHCTLVFWGTYVSFFKQTLAQGSQTLLIYMLEWNQQVTYCDGSLHLSATSSFVLHVGLVDEIDPFEQKKNHKLFIYEYVCLKV